MSTLPSPPEPPSTAHVAFDYAVVDVFAENPLEGNQLAIFCDARGLSDAEMQAIARETNLSETTFILPRDEGTERERGVQVRIFTTEEELPFAGHPTLGTASWLYWNHPAFSGAQTITLDLKVGPISVHFNQPDEHRYGIFGTMKQNDPVFGPPHHRAALAAALRLPLEALDPNLPVQTVTTGNPFCIVPLRSLEDAKGLSVPRTEEVASYLRNHDAKFFYFITRCGDASDADWHARMQFYNGEDPATGSAAGPAIAYLVHHNQVVSGDTITIEQGVEMRRPSRLYVSAKSNEGKISDVCVGGRTILVANGRLFLP